MVTKNDVNPIVELMIDSSFSKLFDDYKKSSDYLKKLSPDEINNKKMMLKKLFLVLVSNEKEIEEVFKLYSKTPVAQNSGKLPNKTNLLEIILSENRLLIEPKYLRNYWDISKSDNGSDFRIIIDYYKDKILSIMPYYRNKKNNIESLGDSL